MANWKKITQKSDLDCKVVYVKVDGIECSDLYNAYWSHENDRWEFIDRNSVTCREWNGEPTHYRLVNS